MFSRRALFGFFGGMLASPAVKWLPAEPEPEISVRWVVYEPSELLYAGVPIHIERGRLEFLG